MKLLFNSNEPDQPCILNKTVGRMPRSELFNVIWHQRRYRNSPKELFWSLKAYLQAKLLYAIYLREMDMFEYCMKQYIPYNNIDTILRQIWFLSVLTMCFYVFCYEKSNLNRKICNLWVKKLYTYTCMLELAMDLSVSIFLIYRTFWKASHLLHSFQIYILLWTS